MAYFSDYVAYFDESGDHGLATIDPGFPAFVLCGCVFKVQDYLQRDLPAFSEIKFVHFGHDAVLFHSRDIRKRIGPFQILVNDAKRTAFLEHITKFFADSTATIIAGGIHKMRHRVRYAYPADPYSISLLFCLERLYAYLLKDLGAAPSPMTCVFERRGEVEDMELALNFARICAGDNMWGQLPFQLVFASKQTNMPGLQIADLAAYPIARHIIRAIFPPWTRRQ